MDEHKNNPGKKLRTLLAGGKTSPLTRLPKKSNNAVSSLPLKADKKDGASTETKGFPFIKSYFL